MVSRVYQLGTKIRDHVAKLFDVGKDDRLKILFLSIIFLLVVAAYTLIKNLKDSIFVNTVGRTHQPLAKLIVVPALIPIIFFYSRLVDRTRHNQLLGLCALFFGISSLVIGYFIGHATIGLYNPVTNVWRLFGWVVYIFGELFSPFLVSVVWAFINSVTNPESAKNNYALIVASSKVGGICAAGFAWFLFSISFGAGNLYLSDVTSHQVVLFAIAVMLLLVPVVLFLMSRFVPHEHLHGYEAAYRLEKQQEEVKEKESISVLAGLGLLLRYPYVLGIFSMIFFYEVINAVLVYLRLGVAEAGSSSAAQFSSIIFKIDFFMHATGLLIALFGTRTLLRAFGERICLMLVPLVIGILLLYLMIYPTPTSVALTFIALKSVNYAFSQPVRESLYIPTTTDIKFKVRPWIDAFGGKIAKLGGASFNWMTAWLNNAALLMTQSFFFAGTIGLWFFAALMLGKRFENAIRNNEVIGAEEHE